MILGALNDIVSRVGLQFIGFLSVARSILGMEVRYKPSKIEIFLEFVCQEA